MKYYTIWFSQRNGSSLLCEGLKSTGMLGNPGEYFTIQRNETLIDYYGATNYQNLQDIVYNSGTSANGVFGIKTNAPMKEHDPIIEELKKFPKVGKNTVGNYAIWEGLFPNCKHIFLTRRNKVRQAVSWWKAIVTNEWHRKSNDAVPQMKEDLGAKYDFDAIKHLLIETTIRESKIQSFLEEGKQKALTVVYEDFIKDFNGTIIKIGDFLGEKIDENQIASPYYTKLADDISEVWVERFRNELQKDWQNKIW